MKGPNSLRRNDYDGGRAFYNGLGHRSRSSSRDEVILREVVRLGFWDSEGGPGKVPPS